MLSPPHSCDFCRSSLGDGLGSGRERSKAAGHEGWQSAPARPPHVRSWGVACFIWMLRQYASSEPSTHGPRPAGKAVCRMTWMRTSINKGH
ncbi:unnamed protein product [Urochloa humidicola]